jgi:hypothetical protein
MAREKTMVSVSVCGSDEFMELSTDAQALYLQLNLMADGSGVVDCKGRVMRGMGVDQSAYQELCLAGFVADFEGSEGKALCLILDWWVNNSFDCYHYFPGAHLMDLWEGFCLSSPLRSGKDKARYVRMECGEPPKGCVPAEEWLKPKERGKRDARAAPEGDSLSYQ